MVYKTQRAPRIFRQMSIDDLLFTENPRPSVLNENLTNTRTDRYNWDVDAITKTAKVSGMKKMLEDFVTKYGFLYEVDRASLYNTFYRAKRDKGMKRIFSQLFKSQKRFVQCDSKKVCGAVAQSVRRLLAQHPTPTDEGLRTAVFGDILKVLGENGFNVSLIDMPTIFKDAFRRIDAPTDTLQNALEELKEIFQQPEFGALYHTSAFAYVKGRSVIDALKRHQQNESRWFGKFDFSDFFGSTTPEFVMKMLSIIHPFSELVKDGQGKEYLARALDLGFLNGGLPQGTKLSPLLTNVIMIPIDHVLSNDFRDFEKQKFIYTRYADDLLVSSKYNFNVQKIGAHIKKVLEEMNAPFTIKDEKTRYGSRAGANWNLGLMLNKDNQITVGWRNKREFQSMLHSYVLDKKNGKPWDLGRIYELEGLRSYYKMVEGDTIDRIVAHVGGKLGANIPAMIKDDIRNLVGVVEHDQASYDEARDIPSRNEETDGFTPW